MRKGRHRASGRAAGRSRGQHRAKRPSGLLDRRVAGLVVVGALAAGGFASAGMVDGKPGNAAPTTADDLAMRERQADAERASRGDTRTAPASSPTPSPLVTSQAPAKPGRPRPVGGLTQRQMDHATTIVRVAERRHLPERAMVVAVATALQESYLHNLANPAVPASFDCAHEGSGSDHDSVGLFQQRPSSGWGPVAKLMDPAYAADRFLDKLDEIDGWETMSVTRAAQSVQASAYPGAYAKHETLARKIVAAVRHPG